MKQEDPQFKLRLKPELKERLEESAKANTRTLGAEIVSRLEASFVAQDADGRAARFTEGAQEELARLAEQVSRLMHSIERIDTKLNLHKRVAAKKPKP